MALVADQLSNVSLEAAVAEACETFIAKNPKSEQAYRRAQESMPGGNTRTVLHFEPFPLTFFRAEGARLHDIDGHEYIDFLGEYTAGLYGHSHPAITQAIETALHSGILRGGPSDTEEAFARTICQRFPAIEQVRFCNSGTEANLYALSAARAFTGREDIIVMQSGYHGGVFYFAGEGPLNVPFPFHRIPFNDVAAAEAKIRQLGDKLAAVIVEPMMGGAGCFMGSQEFLTCLRQETAKVGALLVFDEVMTSRLASGGLHGALGLEPDLVTLGKYLGGGLTFGAFGGRKSIMRHFDPRDPEAWPHAGTFNNNILTMTAGLTGLTEIYTEAAIEDLNARGNALRRELTRRASQLDVPVQVTGSGSMMTVHFSRQLPAGPQDLPDTPKALKTLLHLDLIDRGHYWAARSMINLSLPITDADTQALAEALEEALASRRSVIDQNVP